MIEITFSIRKVIEITFSSFKNQVFASKETNNNKKHTRD